MSASRGRISSTPTTSTSKVRPSSADSSMSGCISCQPFKQIRDAKTTQYALHVEDCQMKE